MIARASRPKTRKTVHYSLKSHQWRNKWFVIKNLEHQDYSQNPVHNAENALDDVPHGKRSLKTKQLRTNVETTKQNPTKNLRSVEHMKSSWLWARGLSPKVDSSPKLPWRDKRNNKGPELEAEQPSNEKRKQAKTSNRTQQEKHE